MRPFNREYTRAGTWVRVIENHIVPTDDTREKIGVVELTYPNSTSGNISSHIIYRRAGSRLDSRWHSSQRDSRFEELI